MTLAIVQRNLCNRAENGDFFFLLKQINQIVAVEICFGCKTTQVRHKSWICFSNVSRNLGLILLLVQCYWCYFSSYVQSGEWGIPCFVFRSFCGICLHAYLFVCWFSCGYHTYLYLHNRPGVAANETRCSTSCARYRGRSGLKGKLWLYSIHLLSCLSVLTPNQCWAKKWSSANK